MVGFSQKLNKINANQGDKRMTNESTLARIFDTGLGCWLQCQEAGFKRHAVLRLADSGNADIAYNKVFSLLSC